MPKSASQNSKNQANSPVVSSQPGTSPFPGRTKPRQLVLHNSQDDRRMTRQMPFLLGAEARAPNLCRIGIPSALGYRDLRFVSIRLPQRCRLAECSILRVRAESAQDTKSPQHAKRASSTSGLYLASFDFPNELGEQSRPIVGHQAPSHGQPAT